MEEPTPYACTVQNEDPEDPARNMYPKILLHVNARKIRKNGHPLSKLRRKNDRFTGMPF